MDRLNGMTSALSMVMQVTFTSVDLGGGLTAVAVLPDTPRTAGWVLGTGLDWGRV